MKKIQSFDFGAFNPFKMRNATLEINKAIKEEKILFSEDFFNVENRKEWEVRYDNSYPNVFYDTNINKYRIYYSTFTKDEESSNYSLEERKNKNYTPKASRIVSLCYAESDDGINWIKPNLGLTEWNGSKENNIIGHYLHGTSVLFDIHEKDPEKKYKMFTKIDYGNGIHFIAVCFSSDGIKFDNFIELPGFNPRADTHNSVIFDEQLNKYVLITRSWRDSLRVPVMSTSSDFINWSPVKEILPPRGYENQVYSMPMFIEGDYRIGLPSMFHEGDRNAADFDLVDLELAYSYQYNGWNYIAPNIPFIERGQGSYPSGDFDNGCIYASLPIKEGDKTYFYYMGGNGQHTNFRETSLSRAYIEHSRYTFYQQKDAEEEAVLYTNGFILLSNELYLNADIENDGYINVELYTQGHEKIKDIETRLEKVDHRYKVVIDKDLERKRTHLKLTFKNAKIYSFEGNLDLFRVESDTSLLRG